jgi:hypothetical protein
MSNNNPLFVDLRDKSVLMAEHEPQFTFSFNLPEVHFQYTRI